MFPHPNNFDAQNANQNAESGSKIVALDPRQVLEDAVADVLSGDKEAFRRIIDLTETQVKIVAISILPDPSLVDDVAQNVFVKIYQHLSEYQTGTNFMAWIKAFARNAALSERKRFLRKQQMTTSLDELERDFPIDPLGLGDRPANEIIIRLQERIEDLPESYREALQRFYFRQESTREIAVLMKRSEASIRVLLHRSRAALIKSLEIEWLTLQAF